MTSKYLVWNVSPIAFSIGRLRLPVALNLFGLGLAVFLYFLGYSWLLKRKRKRLAAIGTRAPANPSGWAIFGLAIASLVAGQLAFAFIPSPRLRYLGPFTVRWYGILFSLAFLTGYFVGSRIFLKAGRPQEQLETLLVYIMIATVVGARLGQVLFYQPGYYFSHPSEILKIWHGGLASHGAAIAILVALWLFKRRHRRVGLLWTIDVVCTCVALGGAFVRIGNFFNSEIVGKVSHLPWAIVFARVDNRPRHPTMLYESLWYLSLFVVLWALWRKYEFHPPEGLVFGLFLIYMFTGRFFLEFTKRRLAPFAQSWPLDMGQILSIPFVLLGIWILWKKVDWKQARRTA